MKARKSRELSGFVQKSAEKNTYVFQRSLRCGGVYWAQDECENSCTYCATASERGARRRRRRRRRCRRRGRWSAGLASHYRPAPHPGSPTSDATRGEKNMSEWIHKANVRIPSRKLLLVIHLVIQLFRAVRKAAACCVCAQPSLRRTGIDLSRACFEGNFSSVARFLDNKR